MIFLPSASFLKWMTNLQDSSEKLKAATYVWSNISDPNLYGEWDFEVAAPISLTLFFLGGHWLMLPTDFSLRSIVGLILSGGDARSAPFVCVLNRGG